MFTLKQSVRGFLAVSMVAACLMTATKNASAADKTILVPLTDQVRYMPELTKGDTEFGGNGPYVAVWVSFYFQNNAVYRQVWMSAVETSSSDSRAVGGSPAQVVFRAPPAKSIKSVHGPRGIILQREMKGHGSYTKPNTAVGRVTVWGDRRGKDIGYHTRVVIDFAYQLPVVLSDVPPNRVTAQLPRQITLMPSLVQGDADFKSNGPQIAVHASLNHTGREARLSLAMIAEETTGGDTRARGFKTVRFYRAPEGFRITRILGTTSFPNMINFADRDLTPNFVNTYFGRATVYGDQKGPDVGKYTRVEFNDIQRPIVIELKRD